MKCNFPFFSPHFLTAAIRTARQAGGAPAPFTRKGTCTSHRSGVHILPSCCLHIWSSCSSTFGPFAPTKSAGFEAFTIEIAHNLESWILPLHPKVSGNLHNVQVSYWAKCAGELATKMCRHPAWPGQWPLDLAVRISAVSECGQIF